MNREQVEEQHHHRLKMNNAIKNMTKYYPIIMNMAILFVMVGYVFEIKQPIIYPFIGQSVYFNILILFLSYKYKFCSWHRILIFSQSVVLIMELLNNYGLKINYYAYICIILIVSALFLSTLLFYFHGRTKK